MLGTQAFNVASILGTGPGKRTSPAASSYRGTSLPSAPGSKAKASAAGASTSAYRNVSTAKKSFLTAMCGQQLCTAEVTQKNPGSHQELPVQRRVRGTARLGISLELSLELSLHLNVDKSRSRSRKPAASRRRTQTMTPSLGVRMMTVKMKMGLMGWMSF